MIKRILIYLFFFLGTKLFSQTDSTLVADSINVTVHDTANTKFNIPLFSTSGGDLDADLEQQDVSALLQASRDIFTQFASFQFGVGRYRMRGYLAENQMIMINGINVNNVETGFSAWSNWGGLNDVTRFVETRFGNVASRYGFSGAGGYTNIDSKASSFRKGSRVSYSSANRIYANRVMLTHSTGLMQNGWAITLSASSRWGNQVYIPGTHFNASAFYLSVDKRLNDKHTFNFTGFGAPVEQGRLSAENKEVYELAGSNFYNSQWGFQDGKVRNANVSKVARPMLLLSHIFNISHNTKLTTSLIYNFGKSSLSGLNWNDAPNPRPNYYRYLPSFYYDQGDVAAGDALKYKWENNIDGIQQINWDRMINMNRANLYTPPSQLGQGVNTTETRSRYILERRMEDLQNIGFNSVYNSRIDNLFISAGLNANIYKNRRYKEMEDLLGGTFWLDVDQFAENLGVSTTYQQNNLEEPDKKIYEGDRFGYDYSTNINRAEIWGQVEYNLNSWDIYGGLSLSDNMIWREGFIANGKFPDNSKGNSKKVNFFNYGVKGGATYKINGRNFVSLNGTYLTRSPEAANIFLAPRVRNDIVKDIKNENVLSADISYLIKSPTFKVKATYYYSQIKNQTWLRTFWYDTYNNNVNLIMTDVDQTHQGIELGVEKKIFISHVLQGAFGYGQFLYSNRPALQAWQDNNSLELFSGRKVYLKNYRVGGPQLVSGIGYRYVGKKYWSAGINFNYFDHIYLEPNPDRRTEEALDKFVGTDDQFNIITEQERLPAYHTLNFNASKSFRIKGKYYLAGNISINNLLNNKNITSSGFEQLRWDVSNISKFDNKYYYMTGLTYQATINFSF